MFPSTSKILIVDDSKRFREIDKMLLTKLGFKDFLEAEDGREALEILKNQESMRAQVNLILLDWNMPVMNGINLLVELKANIKFRSIPVLIVTSERDVTYAVQAVSAGASDFIVKPIDEGMLLDKLKGIWSRLNILRGIR